jgi:inner membrane protein COX18
MGKMINLAPMVQSWAETLKVQVAKESQQQGWPYTKYQQELQKQYSKKVKSIYAHHGCARWKILLLPWVQIPLFVSMSLTLRHMTAYPLPWLGQTAETAALGLSEGGLAWFMDLTAVDPTMVVPVMIGAGNLINVEVRLTVELYG